MSKLPYLCFINSRNSGNSIVPLPSRSASIIKFRTSSSVGFSPMARITFSSSDVLMLPLPSFSFHSKSALTLTPQIFRSPAHSLHSFLPNPSQCPDMAFYGSANRELIFYGRSIHRIYLRTHWTKFGETSFKTSFKTWAGGGGVQGQGKGSG